MEVRHGFVTELSREDEPTLRRHGFLFEACHPLEVISSRSFENFLRTQLVEKLKLWFRKSKVMEEWQERDFSAHKND